MQHIFIRRPTCYGFGAGCAPFGEKFPEALGAVGLVVPACEPLASQRPASGLFPLFFDKKDASYLVQLVQVKHSLCQGSFL